MLDKPSWKASSFSKMTLLESLSELQQTTGTYLATKRIESFVRVTLLSEIL